MTERFCTYSTVHEMLFFLFQGFISCNQSTSIGRSTSKAPKYWSFKKRPKLSDSRSVNQSHYAFAPPSSPTANRCPTIVTSRSE